MKIKKIPVRGNYMSKENGSYHVTDRDPANRVTVGSTGTASEKTLIEGNILDEIFNQKLCNDLKYLIFYYIGIPDLIKMNVLKKKSYLKELTLEVSKRDSHIRILDNLVNELNKWEKSIWEEYTYRGRHTNDKYMHDLLEDIGFYFQLTYEENLHMKRIYFQLTYEENLSWLEGTTKEKYSNIHRYEDYVRYGGYKFITSRNLINLLNLTKRCSNIEDYYNRHRDYSYISGNHYYRAENFHMRLGEIHEEMSDNRAWNIWRIKMNDVLDEIKSRIKMNEKTQKKYKLNDDDDNVKLPAKNEVQDDEDLDWEDLADNVENLDILLNEVQDDENIEDEKYDPVLEQKEENEKKINEIINNMIIKNKELEKNKEIYHELKLGTKNIINDKPLMGHWLYWFFKKYFTYFKDKANSQPWEKKRISKWKKKLIRHVDKMCSKLSDGGNTTCLDINACPPGECINLVLPNILSGLLKATGGAEKNVIDYIKKKHREIKSELTAKINDIKSELKKLELDLNHNKEIKNILLK